MTAVGAQLTMNLSAVQQALAALSKTNQEALAAALNMTGEQVLAYEREQMPRRFHQRVPLFTNPLQVIPRGYRATPDNLQATISLAYPDNGKNDLGTRKDRALSKFGAEQTLVAQNPVLPFFEPTDHLRSAPMDLIPKALYPRNMLGIFNSDGQFTGKLNDVSQAKLTKKGRVKTIKGVKQEGNRYFILGKPGEKDYGIYERTDTNGGSRHGSVHMLWAFHQTLPVHKLLDWEDEARTVFANNWEVNASALIEKAWMSGLTGFGANKFSK